MKNFIRHFIFVFLFMLFVSPAFSQQVNQTGTEDEMPLKTVVIKEPGAEDPASFLSTREHLRFWVYKAGSTRDVSRIVDAIRAREGVKDLSEGNVAGDLKEFVLELSAPRDLNWYGKTFREAGLKYISFNNAPPRALKDL